VAPELHLEVAMRNAIRRPSWLRFLLLAPALATPLTGCSSPSPEATEVKSAKVRITAPTVDGSDQTTLATDDRHFAWDLYQAVRAAPGVGNLAFSPASISIALAMVYGGARGATATEMVATLRFSLPPERLHPAFDALDLALEAPVSDGTAFRLTLANAIWGQQGLALLPDFLDLLAENYGAGVHTVDFLRAPDDARMTINQWVSDQTSAKLPELLGPGSVDSGTALVLTNAVYFHADWRTPFAAMTHDGAFQAPTGSVQVPMMAGADDVMPGWSGTGYHAVSVPYVDPRGSTSMVLVVPDAGTFDAFEAGLTFDALEAILAAKPSTSVVLSMPRFKLQTSLGLAKTLAAMGMKTAFSGDADFSGIDGARDLFIQDVIHQAMVAVDEKGTEAAAATAVTLARGAAVLGAPLVVDRPFIFAIRDDATGTMLFLGRVVDPSKS
jgi:serpin B